MQLLRFWNATCFLVDGQRHGTSTAGARSPAIRSNGLKISCVIDCRSLAPFRKLCASNRASPFPYRSDDFGSRIIMTSLTVGEDNRSWFNSIQQFPSKSSGITSRSEEHTSELQSLMRNSYAVFCLKKKTKQK